jgi:hypothetical protein
MKTRNIVAIVVAIAHCLASLSLWLCLVAEGMRSNGPPPWLDAVSYVAFAVWFPSVLLHLLHACDIFSLWFPLILIANSALWGCSVLVFTKLTDRLKDHAEPTDAAAARRGQ